VVIAQPVSALINSATKNEFQNGSFAGTLGLGLRTVSLSWRQYRRLPVIDSMIAQQKLNQPLFSLRLPRYGDNERNLGVLTLGAVGDTPESANLIFRNIIGFSRYVWRTSCYM
jgi:hypothetical protein